MTSNLLVFSQRRICFKNTSSLFVQRAQVSLYEGTRVPGVLGAMRIHLYTVPVSASADAAESERTSVPLCRILVGPEAYW